VKSQNHTKILNIISDPGKFVGEAPLLAAIAFSTPHLFSLLNFYLIVSPLFLFQKYFLKIN
jgi:hypothetical protein